MSLFRRYEEHYRRGELIDGGDMVEETRDGCSLRHCSTPPNLLFVTLPCTNVSCIGTRRAHVASLQELRAAPGRDYELIMCTVAFAEAALLRSPNVRIVFELNAFNTPRATVDLYTVLLGPRAVRYITRVDAAALTPMKRAGGSVARGPAPRPRPCASDTQVRPKRLRCSPRRDLVRVL